MSTIVLTMASPVSKRTFDTALEPSTPNTGQTAGSAENKADCSLSNATTATGDDRSIQSTPLSSPAASPSPPQSSNMTIPAELPTTGQPPTKKPKLTSEEKEKQRLQKQLEAQLRAEEKEKKQKEKVAKEEQKKEEKRKKDEEKEKARVEREEKQRARDEEKQKKEAEKQAEKQAREDAKAKKERSQLRLNHFFVNAPTTKQNAADSPRSSRRSSICSTDETKVKDLIRAGSEAPNGGQSAYERAFVPFFLHAHTSLAPINRFQLDEEKLANSQQQVDDAIENARRGHSAMDIDTQSTLKRTLEDVFPVSSTKRFKESRSLPTVGELVHQMENGSKDQPIDVETSGPISLDALDALRKIPVKFLKYHEDVRPAYVGTFTKRPIKCSAKKLGRNPQFRAFEPDFNYDYDSELEWEEPEEGEELNSDEEDEDEDEDGNEMDDFLDDEEDANNPKRRNHMGNLEPICSGLIWRDFRLGKEHEVPFGSSVLNLKELRIAPLLETAIGSIDPFSTSYWGRSQEAEKDTTVMSTSMAPPPRGPLNPIAGVNKLLTSDPGSKAKNAAKPLPPELLPDFKRAIGGSVLSKVGLVEVLKKQFPQFTQKTIQSTLMEVAKREGKKEADKKWVLI